MEYQLIRSKRKTIGLEIKEAKLVVRAPMRATNAEINAVLLRHKAWIDKQLAKAEKLQTAKASVHKLTDEELRALANKASVYIPERVKYYAPVIGVSYGKITIRNQRTKWGSCSAKGNLNFNCLLMLAPPEVIDSVVIHELCHRKEMNHSEKFYAEVLRVFPEYRQAHKWLKDNGNLLMAMIDR